jgi:osmotically-inducible protein OsmY
MKPTINDKILRDSVLKELEADPEVRPKHISVHAIDGAIVLGGHVERDHEKHAAVRAAERVPRVRAVADDIEVRPHVVGVRADDEIAEEVAHLRRSGAEIPDSVGVQVRGGRVILHGTVSSASERDAAETAAGRLAGVRVVDNLITVSAAGEVTAADVERRVHEAIARMADANVRSIRVTMEAGTARLHGHLPSAAVLQTALRAAEMAPGVEAVESEIAVTP